MYKMIWVSILMLLALSNIVVAKDTPTMLNGVYTVTVDKVKIWLDDGKEMFILDARKAEQFEEAHLPEAVRCPVNTDIGLSSQVIIKAVGFLQKCEGLAEWPKNSIIVAYCNAHT